VKAIELVFDPLDGRWIRGRGWHPWRLCKRKASENAAGKGRLEVWAVKSEWAYVQGAFSRW